VLDARARGHRLRRRLGRRPLRLNPHVGGLDVELAQPLGYAVAGLGGVIERVPEGRRRVECREHLASGSLDVGLRLSISRCAAS
jgi:hypothetical protein